MFKTTCKKFLISSVLAAVICFSACSKQTETAEQTETLPASVTTVSETTAIFENGFETATGSDLSESDDDMTAEVSAETESFDTGNPESGLVYFIQPIIEQYDEYDGWNLSDWECRDTEVKYDYHYDFEWKYRKELIFVFSNYTEEPVTIDSIQIIRGSDNAPVSFTDGSNALDIDFTVQPGHKTDYLLRAEDFDYSACESGIYHTVANIGLEGYGGVFFINNSELYEETIPFLWQETEQTGIAPSFLTKEQQKVFARANVRMSEFFWCSHYLSEDYAKSHTADDFIGLFTDTFTEDYARLLSQNYLNDDGTLRGFAADRGSDISYAGHCFLPVSSDENEVSFKAVVTYCHEDNPYDVRFEEKDYHMVNTENGWRVDNFSVWF